ncbi:thermonuclease family protein [Campylobacter armoricus]|uniref:Endonuclease, thermonuclease family n=1 Tax=Campylobacter armoricus TaxID=2505970 RepID=A0A7L5HJE1_9BACT|nr:thermonuclease family protein [Campylobacter armoricus]QKF79488.1 endonuclease, thermonuclease family [Campylobacter armoricus]
MKFSKKQINLIIDFIKDPKKFLIIIFLITFAYVLNYDNNSYIKAKISHVIDGDTVEVFYKDERIIIRLFGIDAPEKDQAYGKLASRFLSSIVLNKEVILSVKDEDKYGRILAIMYLNNKDINQVMVKNGFAWAYEYYSDLYLNEQKQAKKDKKGLWEDENPIEPYKWRKQIKLQGM